MGTPTKAAALAINNVRNALNVPNPEAVPKEDELPEGHLRLYDYWMPSLQAGLYSITASQHVVAQGQSQTIANNAGQTFQVVAPQFNLDPKFINSYYPPDGHQAEGHVLPHIVFSDPHIPWLRQAGRTDWMTKVADGRNFVPWMALMVFKAGELDVSVEEARELKLDTIVSGTGDSQKRIYQPGQLPADGAYGMIVGDYLSIESKVNYQAGFPGTSAADYDLLRKSTESTKIIFPTKDYIQGVFNPTEDNQLVGLKRQRLLSHVRQLNTVGFPDASLAGHGYYSIVMSSMTGDMLTVTPTTHVVHLISIEHLDSTLSSRAGPRRTGLVSLFSWTYTCIPEPVNFVEMMRNLGRHMQPLRPPRESVQALQAKAQACSESSDAGDKSKSEPLLHLHQRLQNGYTIARWRAPTGEESVAFNRSPLVPMPVPDVPGDAAKGQWPMISMTGRDYMIYDKSLGMMDATYASAWSLGRLLAISDSVFNAALLRFRSAIWKASTSNLRMRLNGVESWTDVLNRAVHRLNGASQLADGSFDGKVLRVATPFESGIAPSVDDPSLGEDLSNQIQQAIHQSASTSDLTDVSDPNSAKRFYNGYLPSSAASSDWEIIYNWIYEVMFLGGIPAHFLFPEPSHLKSTLAAPQAPGHSKLELEALRFFYIDNAWIDCLIDGALSCANHVEPQYDFTRLKIKEIFNAVLEQKIGSNKYGELEKKPVVPRYGFVLRSAVVKSTPDLKLTVRCWKSTPSDSSPTWKVDDTREHLVRHTKLDDTTILSLIDCLPEEIESIEMAQPAHQQRFGLGAVVQTSDAQLPTSVQAKINIVKLFTNRDRAPPKTENGAQMDPIDLEWKALPDDKQLSDDEQKSFYDPKTRCIDALQMGDKMMEKIVSWGAANGCFDESDGPNQLKGIASSSMFSIEMNDRSAHFIIKNGHPEKPPDSWMRKLWTGPAHQPQAAFSAVQPALRNAIISIPAPPATSLPAQLPISQPLWSGPRPLRLDKSPIPALPPKPSGQTGRGRPPPTGGPQNPFPVTSQSTDSEFELLVHPDYRPPPPRPDTVGGKVVHSVRDYLPTNTKYLYDLIFSIRRRRPNNNLDLVLRTLQIEIPVSLGNLDDDARDLDGNGNPPREPLLQAGDSAFGAVSMAYNERFVPLLFDTFGAKINHVRWDGKDRPLPVLLLTLTPKSGTLDGTMRLANDGRSTALAVRLANVRLAPIIKKETLMVYRRAVDGNGATPPERGKDQCGKVPIRMTEFYGGDIAMKSSWAEVIKLDQGDSEIDGP